VLLTASAADIMHRENGSTAILVRVPATYLPIFDAWVDGQSPGRLTPPAIRGLIEEQAQGDIKRPTLLSSSASTRSSRVEARAITGPMASWML
jgi:hypothetical protein